MKQEGLGSQAEPQLKLQQLPALGTEALQRNRRQVGLLFLPGKDMRTGSTPSLASSPS